MLTIVIAAVALREQPTAPQVAGIVLGVVGLVVVGFGRGGHVPLLALGLCLMAALMWAIGNVISRASGATGGLSLTVWSALVVPVPLMALSVLVEGPGVLAQGVDAFGWRAALSTLFTAGIASLVGYGLFNTLLSRNPSGAVVPWILLVPPVAIGSAWLLLDEVPSTGELVGGALLVLGVLVAQRQGWGVADPPGRPSPPRHRWFNRQGDRDGQPPAASGSGVRPDPGRRRFRLRRARPRPQPRPRRRGEVRQRRRPRGRLRRADAPRGTGRRSAPAPRRHPRLPTTPRTA